MNPFIAFLTSYIELTKADIESFEKALETRSFKAGDIILKEKSVCRHIVFLVSGKARSFFTNHDGQEYTWCFLFNDHNSNFQNYFLIDYHSFLTQSPTHLTIEAIEDVDVIMLPYEKLQKLTSNSLNIATLNSRMSEIAYQNIHKRAVSLLTLNARERYLQLLEEEPFLLHYFKQYLVASYLGLAPQSLSRLRNEITTL